MGLEDRLVNQGKLSSEQEENIISRVKDRIKKDNIIFDKTGFYNSENLGDELYMLISSEIEGKYPFCNYKIEDNLIEKMLSEIFGLGVLEKYLHDKTVTDIFVHNREMVIIKNGVKEYLGEVFSSLKEVYLVIDRIKGSSGMALDQRVPFLNTELYDGSRCSIVIPPVSDKIYISIRVFNCIEFELEDLLRLDMFDCERFEILKSFVTNRKNILIAGPMGSGKTTLLNTLAKLIPKSDFINIIQDVPEIKLSEHPYVRMLTTRPNYMAAYQMLQALNTGHRGSFSTIHADSAYDALLRLETLAMEYRPNITVGVIKKIISRAIDVVLFLEYKENENLNITSRKLKEILLVGSKLGKEGDYKLEYL